jgi:hypothetical protein
VSAERTHPTAADIDALLAFLPRFEQPGRTFVRRWEDAGAFPTPVYDADVVAFFELAGQACWTDEGYVPAEAAAMLRDDTCVASATLDEIKTMLTYAVRGERFTDGHWASLLETGRISSLLRRLADLRQT